MKIKNPIAVARQCQDASQPTECACVCAEFCRVNPSPAKCYAELPSWHAVQ